MIIKFIPLFSWLILGLFPVSAQLSNQVFLRPDSVIDRHKNHLYFAFDNLSFFRNNEYFNPIVAGYTLFGYHLNPEFTYQPAANVKLRGGVFLWKDFGNPGFSQAAPTFSVKMQFDSLAVVFGTLEGNLNHQLIEPLLDFERVLNNRLENGLQFLYRRNRIQLDTWVDWQQMIYPDSDFQEVLSVGLSSAYRLVQNERLQIRIPVQLQAYHRGGQIGVRARPLTNWFNGAIGVSNEHYFGPDALIRSFRMDNYLVFYSNNSPRLNHYYTQGSAMYMNFSVKTRWLECMASYWLSNRFRSVQGGHLYQSVAVFPYRQPDTTRIQPPPVSRGPVTRQPDPEAAAEPHREPDRELLILRFMKDIKVTDGFFLTLRLEPVFNLPDRTFEFSHGFYLNYRQNFFLKKVVSTNDD